VITMTYILTPIQGILVLVLNLIAPLIVLICLPFIRWDGHQSVGPQRTNPPTPTEMGDWPEWLAWLRTPDQRLPCDTGIAECKQMLDEHGKWFTAFVWAGIRNPLMGLACWFGSRTSDYIPEGVPGLWSRQDSFGYVWKYSLSLGPVWIITGHNVYRLIDGSFRSAPVFTVKKK